MQKNKRVLAVGLLLWSLVHFHYVFEAQEPAPSWQVIAIAMSDNGRYLAVRTGVKGTEYPNAAHEIWVYHLENLLLPPKLLAGDIETSARMIFSPNNRYLAVASLPELSIFDIEEGVSILDLQRTSTEPPTDFGRTSFSPDSNYVMSFSDWWFRDSKMSIWNIHTGQRIHAIDAQRGRERVYYTWLSPDWSQLARWSGPSDNAHIYEFDIENGLEQPLASLTENGRTGVFSPDGTLFAVITADVFMTGNVKVLVYETDTWALKTSKLTSVPDCGARNRLRFSYNNSLLLLVYKCLFEEWTWVWNLTTDVPVIEALNYAYTPASFTLNDRFMIGSGESGIAVWNIKSNFEITEYPGRAAAIYPNGEFMVSIGPDGRLWIWNLELKQLLIILPVPRH
ncbi:MAG: WD40 repeat domain-containing protein [Chloroflexi bacterium]|nr:WD40 repeat domain-containing protein [Chloroflexota bacterium]